MINADKLDSRLVGLANASHDVIILGSGAAGMAAALTAKAAGLSVLVIEKTQFYGGSTAVSGGAVWIPENQHMGRAGHTDSREQVMRYLRGSIGEQLQADQMKAYLDQGPRMVAFMERHTSVKFSARESSPDYNAEVEGASLGGRTLDPLPFDGRELGPMFDALRVPLSSFMVLGGMMVGRKDIDAFLSLHRSWKAFLYSTRLVLRHLRDRLRWKRGTRLLMGNALAGRLLKSAIDMDVELLCGVTVSRLLVEGGVVCGVELPGRGKPVLRARSVVLATGGFAQNSVLRERHIPHAAVHRSMAPEGNTGDGLVLASAVGGILGTDNIGPAFWTPVSIMKRPDASEEVYPHLIMDRQKPGLMAVNRDGVRFTNEAESYHAFVMAMHRTDAVPAWLVCDRVFLQRYGLGLVRPRYANIAKYIKAGYLLEAESIEALAGKMGVPAVALAEAVARMNAFAASGVDTEFGRGESAYSRYLGDPAHKPNPCLGPISTAPFYAVKVWPGDIGTATGLRVDTEARVLDSANKPIPGLYACGNDMNSVMSGTYPGAGITLGPGLTFGYIAGKAIARKMGRNVESL